MFVSRLLIIFLCLYVYCTGAQEHALSPPYTCTTTTTMCKPVGSVDQVHATTSTSLVQGRPGKRGAAGTKGQKGQKGDPCECDIADEEAMERLRQTVRTVEEKNREMNEKIENLEDRVKLLALPSNCGEYQMYGNEGTDSRSDGLAEIYPRKTLGSIEKVLMNCTLYQTDDEGWIIIQKRYDGSVDFYRDWESYARGFGDRDGEFWLGLRTIHQITNQQRYELHIDLEFKGGAAKHAEYSSFHVGNEHSKFKLTVSGYSGNAGDRVTHHSGQAFTTFDSDNDNHSTVNCAVHFRGAWWYKSCYDSNLNGKYDSDFDWPHGTHLSSSEMKIRPI